MVNLTAQPYYVLSARELAELVETTYNVFDFECNLGASNSTAGIHTGIKKGHYLYDEAEVQQMVNKKNCGWDQVYYLLYALCEKDVIPAGDYRIDFSW